MTHPLDLDDLEAYRYKAAAVLDRFAALDPQALDAGRALLAELDVRFYRPLLARLAGADVRALDGVGYVVDAIAGVGDLSVVVDVVTYDDVEGDGPLVNLGRMWAAQHRQTVTS